MNLTLQEIESLAGAGKALAAALRAEGIEGAKADQVGPVSGFDHYSILVGSGHGKPDEISDFVNRLRGHL